MSFFDKTCNHISQSRKLSDQNASILIEISSSSSGNLRPHRTRMVNWMIEVLNAFHAKPKVFFMSVHLLDSYFKASAEEPGRNCVHLVGVTCMFVACKLEYVERFTLQSAVETVTHNTISREQIKETEKEVLKRVDCELHFTVCVDVVGTLCREHGLPLCIEKNALIVLHLVQFYHQVSRYSATQQGVSALLAVLTHFRLVGTMCTLLSEPQYKTEEIKVLSQRMLEMAINFKVAFPGCSNPEEFLGFSFAESELLFDFPEKELQQQQLILLFNTGH